MPALNTNASIGECAAHRVAGKLPRMLHKASVQILWLRDRDGNNCHICGKPMTWDKGRPTSATRDHVKPKSRSSGDALTNFRLAHKLCNERRGNADVP